MRIPKCPECGEEARGTLETVKGVAGVFYDKKAKRLEWTGDTEIWWDEQKTVYADDGRAVWICPQGHDFASAAHPDEEPSIQVSKK